MIRNCNIAIYYRLIIYSNIKDDNVLVKGSGSWNDDDVDDVVGVPKFGGQIWWTSWRFRQLKAKP